MANRKGLGELFVPIALETVFMMLTGTADTMMLSAVSNTAVGAVGTANSYINIFIIMLGIISSGMVAVTAQYIGAGRLRVAGQALRLGLLFNAIVGCCISAVLYFGYSKILTFAGVAPGLFDSAALYLKIVGGCCILNALISVFSSYLRCFGFTRVSLTATVAANLLNLILNAVLLFGLGWGVAGVALATVISRGLNLSIIALFAALRIRTKDGSEPLPPMQILKQMLRIGLPAACETALYNFASALTIRFLNQMDTEGIHITARTYAQQIANFAFCGAAAMSQANGLISGWQIGAGEFDACDAQTRRSSRIAICIGASIAALFALFSRPILGLFTNDPVLLQLTARLLMLDILLEVGRSANMVYGQALKVSGDALYTSMVGAVFMYLIMVGGTWLLGLRLGWLSVGAYCASASDECIRAVLLRRRWRSGKWRSKGVIRRKPNSEQETAL